MPNGTQTHTHTHKDNVCDTPRCVLVNFLSINRNCENRICSLCVWFRNAKNPYCTSENLVTRNTPILKTIENNRGYKVCNIVIEFSPKSVQISRRIHLSNTMKFVCARALEEGERSIIVLILKFGVVNLRMIQICKVDFSGIRIRGWTPSGLQ